MRHKLLRIENPKSLHSQGKSQLLPWRKSYSISVLNIASQEMRVHLNQCLSCVIFVMPGDSRAHTGTNLLRFPRYHVDYTKVFPAPMSLSRQQHYTLLKTSRSENSRPTNSLGLGRLRKSRVIWGDEPLERAFNWCSDSF
jgi:hypothetical protein